jgi:signal transduction histidine kinase
LMSATGTHEVLVDDLYRALNVTDALVPWAALSAPTEQLRALVSASAKITDRAEIAAILEEARTSLRRSESMLSTLRDFAATEDSELDASELLVRLGDLLRGHVGVWADLHVGTAERCPVHASRSTLAYLVVSMIASSIESLKPTGRPDGLISLKASIEEGTLVIEIEDNGLERVDDGRSEDPSRSLAAARQRAQRLGGELLVDSDGERTVMRVLLPVDSRRQMPAPEPTARLQQSVALRPS